MKGKVQPAANFIVVLCVYMYLYLYLYKYTVVIFPPPFSYIF